MLLGGCSDDLISKNVVEQERIDKHLKITPFLILSQNFHLETCIAFFSDYRVYQSEAINRILPKINKKANSLVFFGLSFNIAIL